MHELDPDRTILAIGGYGYDWIKGQQSRGVTFEEAVLSAKISKRKFSSIRKRQILHSSYDDDDGNRHDVWFLDGVTAYNEIEAGDASGVAGYALWRMGGSEDQSLWKVFRHAYGAAPPDA